MNLDIGTKQIFEGTKAQAFDQATTALQNKVGSSLTASMSVDSVIKSVPGLESIDGLDSSLSQFASMQDTIQGLGGTIESQIKSQMDCIASIPEKLLSAAIDALTQLAITYVSNEIAAFQNFAIDGLMTVVSEVMDLINNFKIPTLSDLVGGILGAAGFDMLGKLAMVGQMIDQFGNVVSGILDSITSFDICSFGEKTITSGFKSVFPLPEQSHEPPPPFPMMTQGVKVNAGALKKSNDYRGVMFEIGQLTASSVGESLSGSPEDISYQNSVQSVARRLHNMMMPGWTTPTNGFEDPNVVIQKELEAKRDEWGEGMADVFLSHCDKIKDKLVSNAGIISAFGQMSSPIVNTHGSPSHAEPLEGTKVLTGISITGTPETNYLEFLKLRDADRSPALVEYWESQGKNIAADEITANSHGIKIGTKSKSDVNVGEYGLPNISGKTVKSTRFPGGSILKLTTSSGKPYDPTGTNPTGEVVVTGYEDQKRLYNTVDLYVEKEHYEAAVQSDIKSVNVELVTLGDMKSNTYKVHTLQYGDQGMV